MVSNLQLRPYLSEPKQPPTAIFFPHTRLMDTTSDAKVKSIKLRIRVQPEIFTLTKSDSMQLCVL